MIKPLIFSIAEIHRSLVLRRKDEFDTNLGVCGWRGLGKSTLLSKLFYRFKDFDPWIHQVYSRPDVIKLLKTQYNGLCLDDEAINSGYKRDFQNKGQQELIKILTAYRDNFNVHASAIPNFFSLDKDLRDLYSVVFYILERGVTIVHMPIPGRMYSNDKWDAKYNAKIEESWSEKIKKNPNFKPPYHKLTTFRGYLYFNDMTERQKKLYKEVKAYKRNQSFHTEEEKKANQEVNFMDKVYNMLINKKLTKDGLMQVCLTDDKKYSTVTSVLNRMLTDKGVSGTVTSFLRQTHLKPIHNRFTDEINRMIPDI